MHKSILAISIGMQMLRNSLSQPLNPDKSNRILVVSNGHFGDFVHSIPMIKVLSSNNEVSVLTKESNKIIDFESDFTYVDEDFASHHKWDLIIVCSDDGKSRWRGNVVYADGIRSLAKIMNKWHERHWAEFFLDIAKEYDKTLNKELWGHQTLLQDTVSSMSIPTDNTGWVVIHPGASSPDKSWELEKYLDLYLNVKMAGFKPILLVTKYDKFVMDALKQRKDIDRFQIYNINDTKNLSEIAKRTKMFIGNDSGVMHYFSLFNCDVFGIFTYGCADSHYPWTTRGYFYFDRSVYKDFYTKGVIRRITLPVGEMTKEVLSVLKGNGLTDDNKNFFDSEELMEYV